MSIAEYIFNYLVGSEDENSLNSYRKLQNNGEFRLMVGRSQSVEEFRPVIEYFLARQRDESVQEIFFQFKFIHKLCNFIVYESNNQVTEMGSIRTDGQQGSRKIMEAMKILIHLVTAISQENDLVLNQMFSGVVLEKLLTTIQPMACRMPEYYLLIRAICLKLTESNVNLFINGNSRSFELYRIACSLPLDIEDYHLSVIQKNIILIISKCLSPLVLLEYRHLQLGYLEQFMYDRIFMPAREIDSNLDLVIDDFMFLNDFLSICTHLSPDYYQSLFKGVVSSSSCYLLICLSADLVHHYDPIDACLPLFQLLNSKIISETGQGINVVKPKHLFYWLSMCRSLIVNCQVSTVMSALHICPSHQLLKQNLISNLLNSPPRSTQIQIASKSRPSSASRRMSNPPSPMMPHRTAVNDFGPLTPSSKFVDSAVVDEEDAVVQEGDKVRTISSPPIDIVPSRVSRGMPASLDTSLQHFQNRHNISGSGSSGLHRSKKKSTDFQYHGSDQQLPLPYEESTIDLLIDCLLSVSAPEYNETIKGEVKILLEFSICSLISALLSRPVDNPSFYNLLNAGHQQKLKSYMGTIEFATQESHPLLKSYFKFSFSEFLSKNKRFLGQLDGFNAPGDTKIDSKSIIYAYFFKAPS